MKVKVVILVFSLGFISVGTTDILPPGLKNNMLSAVLPGYQTSDLSGLEPEFRGKVEGVLSELVSLGFRPRVHATFRSQEYQNFIFDLSVFQRKFTGRKGLTTTKQSCHSKESSDGTPAARAVDIRQGVSGPHLYLPIDQLRADHVDFYHQLGALAKEKEIRWGGDFKGESMWSPYGLGWDPGHISWKC